MPRRVTATTTIGRPIDEVFAILTDVERTGSWFPGDVREWWTTPPPHGVGSTRHALITTLGRRSENDAVVTAYDPPRLAALRGTSPQASFEATLAFAEAPGGTRVDVVVDLDVRGASRFVARPFSAWYGRQWVRGLATLKGMLEAGEPPPARSRQSESAGE
jgi:uncharacterized protein YndB with AHSA1/START domain